jgi:DNA-binding transcriptional LysR family regulator
MDGLRRRLPSPNSLVVFEAAARLASFTAASRELGVTQAAVSRQIHNLENSLGAHLFDREYRQVGLTPAGTRLYSAVSLGLEHIAACASELRLAPDLTQITLASTVAVSAFWLRPRIAEYMATNPGVEIRLIATDDDRPDAWKEADLSIRYGRGRWPGTAAEYLFEEEIFLVCSPQYEQRVREPADLLRETLLHFDRKSLDWIDWSAWLQHFGCRPGAAEHGLRFNNYAILIQAVIERQGIALGWKHMISQLVDKGLLVRVLDVSLRTDRAYWLSWNAGATLRSPVLQFRDWLLGCV